MKFLVYSLALGLTAAAAARAQLRPPLAFEPNLGQAAPHHRFLTRVGGTAVGFGDAQVSLPGTRLRFLGGRPVRPVAENPLPGVVNYFHGSNPQRWLRGVRTFGALRSAGVWKGVDLRWHESAQHQLEYDVIVQPGGTVADVRLGFSGTKPQLLADGSLRVGALRWNRPIAYQTLGTKRVPVAARYRLDATGSIGFSVERYDRTKPLVIDPVLVSSSFVGGTGDENVLGVASDPTGAAYVFGVTNAGVIGQRDFVVTKVSSAGVRLYTTYVGGTGNEGASALGGIAADSIGNVYFTSDTFSTNYPTTLGVFQPSSGGRTDAVLTKLDATGTLAWSTYMGGTQDEYGAGIAVNAAGQIAVVGQTTSSDLSVTPGAFQTTRAGIDAFVSIFSPAGSTLSYSTFLGGSEFDFASSVAFGPTGRLYVTGGTYSPNFPIQLPAGVTHNGLDGGSDSFLVAFNTDRSLRYSNRLGGSSEDQSKYGGSVTVDASDNATVVGQTSSTNFPTINAFQATHQGSTDAFVYQLNPEGVRNWATYLGGSGGDNARTVTVDGGGFLYVTGNSGSNNFPLDGAFFTNPGGYVLRLTPQGMVAGSTFLDRQDGASAVAIVPNAPGDVYVAGNTTAATMPTLNPAQASFGGGFSDGFLARVHFDAVDVEVTQTATPSPYYSGDVLTFTLQVTNNGPDTASSVVLTDALSRVAEPDSAFDFSVVGMTTTQGTISRSGNTVTANLGRMVAGATATIRISVQTNTPSGIGTLTSQASVVTTPGDARPLNNRTTTGVRVNADTRPRITGLSPELVAAGGGSFTLTVNGRYFYPGATVLVNDIARPTSVATTERVTTTILASDIATPRSLQIKVRVGSNTSAATVLRVGTPRLTFTATAAHRTPSGWRVTVLLRNTGTAEAPAVRVTGGTLATRATTTALPQLVGLIPNTGSPATIDLDFPEAAGVSGASVAFRLTGTYSGGTFGGTAIVRLP